MTATVRRALGLLPVLALLAPFAAGCSDDADPAADPEGHAASAPSAGPAEQGLRTDLPTGLERTCTSYARMVDGIDAIDGDQDLDELAAEMAAVMTKWAGEVPDLGRPKGMDAATWRGMRALAQRIRQLPDDPTMRQLEAVERDLSAEEKAVVDDASAWFKENCGIS